MKQYRILIVLFVLFFLLFFVLENRHSEAQGSSTFTGKLDPELVPDMVHVYSRVLNAVKDSSKYRFTPSIGKGAIVTGGEISDQRLATGKNYILLVEPPDKAPFFCVDTNSDGIIEQGERFTFASPTAKSGDFEQILNLPVKNPFFKSFPIYIRYKRGFNHPQLAATDRLLFQSVWALAFGRVTINKKSVLFQYPFDPQAPVISTREGLFGIDVDGDGKIRNEQFSPETSYAQKDELVFRLGDTYVSTSTVDLEKNEIVLRSRHKSEYQKQELEVGKEMTDFAFTDFEGKKRSLSEFRGKYVMVDFWGLWCVDCLRETPFHLAAYERFKAREFEILALDTDEDIEPVKAYLKKNNITWTQAQNDSIRTLVERTYRIQEYPSSILLGPDGKVLILDQHRLLGNELLKTLDQILPK